MPATLPLDTPRMLLWIYRTLRVCVVDHHQPSTSHVLTAHDHAALDGSDGQIHSKWPWMVADSGSKLVVDPPQTGPASGPSADG